jgi:hypothetical protein
VLTLELPTLLALVGTALMAVVIFAPRPLAMHVAASCAPPAAPAPVTHWYPAPDEDLFAPPAEPADDAVPPRAMWPGTFDPRAAGCAAEVRLELIDALSAIRTSWADAVLRHALHDDPDASVRDAAAAALSYPAGLA